MVVRGGLRFLHLQMQHGEVHRAVGAEGDIEPAIGEQGG